MSKATSTPLTGWMLVSLGGILFASGFGVIYGAAVFLMVLGLWTAVAGLARLAASLSDEEPKRHGASSPQGLHEAPAGTPPPRD